MNKYKMKALFSCFLLLVTSSIFAQFLEGSYTDMAGNTTTVKVKEAKGMVRNSRHLELQQSVTVSIDGRLQTFTPKDITSFSFQDKDKTYIFDSLDGLFFAERLYAGKASLHKILVKPSYKDLFRTYLLRKPGQQELHQMTAVMGLSRLLTKKEMKPAFQDCPLALEKIENETIKIKDEDKLVDFVKDYEQTCF